MRERVDRDSPPQAIRRAIVCDPYLSSVYHDMYSRLLDQVARTPISTTGTVVEIGGAPGMVHDLDPRVLVTDVIDDPTVDITCRAEVLPFGDGAIRAIIMKDVLHHIPDVPAFMAEADRVLAPGGCVACIEPYWSPLARFVFRHLHPEPYDEGAAAWGGSTDERWDSNQALAYILLRRDRAAFEQSFPNFLVEEGPSLTGPSYVLSGGVFSRTPIPGWVLSRMLRLEQRLGPRLRWTHLHLLFTLSKRDRESTAAVHG